MSITGSDSKSQKLRDLREAAGLSQREMAKQLGIHHSNLGYWERSGHLPPGDVLSSMAKILRVSVDQIVGLEQSTRSVIPHSRARKLFETISRMPRRQQDKILEVVEALVDRNQSQTD